MKLYYVRTNGYDMIVATDGERTVECTEHDFYNDDFAPRKFEFTEDDHLSSDSDEFRHICLRELIAIADFNDFEDLYNNWTAGEPEDYPHPSIDSDAYDACEIIAEYDTAAEPTDEEKELIAEVQKHYE